MFSKKVNDKICGRIRTLVLLNQIICSKTGDKYMEDVEYTINPLLPRIGTCK